MVKMELGLQQKIKRQWQQLSAREIPANHTGNIFTMRVVAQQYRLPKRTCKISVFAHIHNSPGQGLEEINLNVR